MGVDGLANFRDLGGRERTTGARTPTGVFFRAEILDRVTPDGWDALRQRGVQTIIDLRRPRERSGAIPGDLTRFAVDLDGDDPAFWAPLEADGLWCTPLYYGAHLDALPDRLREVLDAIADAPPGGILFHCGAGWDRTGLVAAMLLRAADVTPGAATEDYLVSYANADAMEALHGRPSEVEARRRILGRFDHTPESAFRAAYDALDVSAWFAHADVPHATRRAVLSWRGAIC